MLRLASIAQRDAKSPWTRTAVLSSIAGRPTALLGALARRPGFFSGVEGSAWLDQLAYLVGVERDPEQLRSVMDQVRRADLGSLTLMRTVLAISRGLQRSGASLPGMIRLGGELSDRLTTLLAEAVRSSVRMPLRRTAWSPFNFSQPATLSKHGSCSLRCSTPGSRPPFSSERSRPWGQFSIHRWPTNSSGAGGR